MNYKQVASLVQPPNNREKIVKDYQSTNDIIKDLIYCFKNYNYQAQPVIKFFASGDIKKDGRKIYDFIKNNIEYEAEPEGDQTTRSFSRIIHDKWGDCKHNALLVSSIAWNMGYNVIFKFVGYERGASYGHVYAIIEDPKTKEQVIIDPLQAFNFQKPYIKAINYIAVKPTNTNTMLSRLTGIEQPASKQLVRNKRNFKQNFLSKKTQMLYPVMNELQGIGEIIDIEGVGEVRMISPGDIEGIGKGKLKKKVQQVKANIKKDGKNLKAKVKSGTKQVKANIKKDASKIKSNIKARGGVVKTVYLAPIRAAGSALILANFRNFAGRMQKLPINDQKAFAKKFGYNFSTLQKQIAIGAKKKPVFGSKTNGICGMYDTATLEGIGVISLAAAAITAAPIILALTKLFKDKKLEDPSDLAAAAAAAVDIATSGNADNSGSSDTNQQPANVTLQKRLKDIEDASDKIIENFDKRNLPKENQSEQSNAKSDNFFDKVKDSFKEHPLWYFGGATVLVYLAGKEFKVFSK